MRALFGPPVAPQEFGGLPLRTAYPSEAEREHQAAAVSGLVPDTWHCALCDSYIVGEDNVQRHADTQHRYVGYKKMRNALTLVGEPPPGRSPDHVGI